MLQPPHPTQRCRSMTMAYLGMNSPPKFSQF
jgi:hypothetical protein